MRDFVKGTTVIGLKYNKGVIIAADTKASYGRLCKTENVVRIHKIAENTLVGFSGEISDMQYLKNQLEIITEEENREITPLGYHKIIQRIMYSARSKMEPLNLNVVISGAGLQDDGSNMVDESGRMLTCVNQVGNFYSSDVICTGLGSYLVLPFLREKVENMTGELTRDTAIMFVEEALKLLVYRDTAASNSVVLSYVEDGSAVISEKYKIPTNFEVGLLEEEIVLEE